MVTKAQDGLYEVRNTSRMLKWFYTREEANAYIRSIKKPKKETV